ncbi:hypothetical protein, conserved [Entamoeba dispar SAW760]|uniref:AIG1-type G domain-containing protein n=1 Tax=Entamoeba dispar (strain ATCC PRA-260 / SAW760) TaxID=370354 RepID=B0ECH5_ENTDS|nr:uncharacterized protein EDI_001050 [Entamoeba dispar SAW760]EDR27771.1 hypothetical protein, conserved [Entamoeba dispar SAW760]|eukprot:EDR27771.1 hypothetical protein, conserved [Entamoeba dispar SAW760]
MSIEETKKTKLIMIGNTGDGKSSLGNFILKKKSNGFEVSDEAKSVTQKTEGSYGEGDRSDVFVIDTPGLQDSGGLDKDRQHMNEMVDYVKKQEGLQGIVIVLNCTNDRLSANIKAMIKLLCTIFPISDFWEHVCIVWTKCFNYTPLKKIEKQIQTKNVKFLPEVIKLAEETTGDKIVKIPMYFVDSRPDDDEIDNTRSEDEIVMLLTWARSLPSINVGKVIKNGSESERVIIEEKNEHQIIESDDVNIKYKINYMRREKRIKNDGTVEYSEWEVIKTKYKNKPIPKQYSKKPKKSFLDFLGNVGGALFELIMNGFGVNRILGANEDQSLEE